MSLSAFPELYFNVDNGYLEGLVRGFKAGLLKTADYRHLQQCETPLGTDGGIHVPRVLCIYVFVVVTVLTCSICT
uniref:Uncharacterized protein n=1 Tax=Vombatus ursinus TaxID=29139 RepID=A0A4X2L5H3_VOMUR